MSWEIQRETVYCQVEGNRIIYTRLVHEMNI